MNKYSSYTPEQLEELTSNYLVDSWSYSRVALFARNEKEFEREAVYHENTRSSASAVAGNAYHAALCFFFNEMKEGRETSIVDMNAAAFAYIDNVPANAWKLQKTTPTVEQCVVTATKMASVLVNNFFAEKNLYIDNIKEVLDVELYCDEWLSINGVDIPLPCHAVLDLVIRDNSDNIIVIDHKSKRTYTDEEEIVLTHGKQAITYTLTYESKTGQPVSAVWFIENKVSENKDKSAQLRRHVIKMGKNERHLYEALLYEPLRRMIEAVSNPDYVYVLNDTDSLSERPELYRFWAKTLVAEADDFNIPDNKKELIRQRQRKIRDATLATINPRVITDFKKNAAAFIQYDLSNTDMNNGEKIEHVLRTFGIITKVAHTMDGYSSDTYLLEVSAGVKLSNVLKYKLDIANALNVSTVRIPDALVVYQDRSYLAIEVSKKNTKNLPYDEKQLVGSKIPIGIDNYGNTVVWDIDNPSTPHMLICGATGSGKSVCIKSTIEYVRLAGISHIIVLDPKYEFGRLKGCEVVSDISDIEKCMSSLVSEMQNRAKNGVSLYTLVVFDEFADAVSSARSGRSLDIKDENGKVIGRERSLEENMKMLLQKGRSLGFRVIAATQRASTKVITGDAKVNFPVQVCFRVPKAIDSKVVLDEEGAESLAGKGDGLMRSPEYDSTVRFQGFYKA